MPLGASARIVSDRSFMRLGIVASSEGEIPAGNRRDCSGVGIDKQLIRVETMTVVRRVRSGHTISIQLPGLNSFQPDVPYITRFVANGIQKKSARGNRVIDTVKEIQTHTDRVAAEDRKIHAGGPDLSAQRKRHARPHGLHFAQAQQPFQFRELGGTRSFRTRLLSVHKSYRALKPRRWALQRYVSPLLEQEGRLRIKKMLRSHL